MKHTLIIILLSFVIFKLVSGQNFTEKDSLKLVESASKVIQYMENSNEAEFIKISNDSINCLLCKYDNEKNYHGKMTKLEFFELHREYIIEYKIWKDAIEKKIIQIQKNILHYGTHSVTYEKIWKDAGIDNNGNKHDLSTALIFYFILINEEYMLSGIETLP